MYFLNYLYKNGGGKYIPPPAIFFSAAVALR